MLLVAFLPSLSLVRLRRVFPNQEVRSARGWADLRSLIVQQDVAAAVIDPSADGSYNVEAAVELLRARPLVPVFAYVAPTGANLRAILQLSRHGLEHAFLTSGASDNQDWRNALDRASTNRLAYALLNSMEARIGQLPFNLGRTIADLFERPHHYDSTADIAREARIGTRCLYRNFERVGLGTPKKLLTVAKVVRGYSFLLDASAPLMQVSYKLRYSHPASFAQATAAIFGCSPSKLREIANSDEILLHLLEWLYKPTRLSRAMETRQRAATLGLIKAPRPVADRNEDSAIGDSRSRRERVAR